MDLLRHLRYFVVVADEESVTAAARRLGMQQPPLSRALTRLESELGVSLLTRSADGVRLTQAGRLLLPEARQLVGQADALPGYLGLGGDVARLTIAVPALLPTRLMVDLQHRFARRLPGTVLVPLPATARERALRDGGVEAALRAGDQGLAVPLGVAHHPDHGLAHQDELHPTDLDGWRVVLLDEDEPSRAGIEESLQRRGFSDSLTSFGDARAALARCGDGVSVCVCGRAEASDAGLSWRELGLPPRRWSFVGPAAAGLDLLADVATVLEVSDAGLGR